MLLAEGEKSKAKEVGNVRIIIDIYSMYTSVFDIHVDNIQNSACSMDMYIMYYIIVYYIYV